MISPFKLLLKLFHIEGSLTLWLAFENLITAQELEAPKYPKIVNVLWLHAYECCLMAVDHLEGQLMSHSHTLTYNVS